MSKILFLSYVERDELQRIGLHIPLGYGYTWQLVVAMLILKAPILELVVDEPWKDWSPSEDLYHKLIEDRACLVMKVSHTWHITHGM